MRLDSINVGEPREVEWEGRRLITSIFKKTIEEPVKVSYTNLEGDKQSDLAVHGGITRAISVYASEYYDFWRKELKLKDLPWGFFGENLNITGGMFETEVNVGDRFAIGDVELEAVQPRFPCHKLGMKMGDKKWIKTFLESRKTGFYFKVLNEGTICSGQEMERTYINKDSITIDNITDLYLLNKNNKTLLKKALKVQELTDSWKKHFQKQLSELK